MCSDTSPQRPWDNSFILFVSHTDAAQGVVEVRELDVARELGALGEAREDDPGRVADSRELAVDERGHVRRRRADGREVVGAVVVEAAAVLEGVVPDVRRDRRRREDELEARDVSEPAAVVLVAPVAAA